MQANKDIHLAVRRGTIHGIVGENGAGKSTLMSILYGFYHADAGEIRINGAPTPIPDSQAAIRAGIGMVHQHFMLVETFTVLENVVLGAEESARCCARRSPRRAARAEAARARNTSSTSIPTPWSSELSVGLQQRVEILKALYRQADILILDEPTGVLTPAEADHLFRILGILRDQGKTIILITHKLREIMAITDEVTVMRRGEMVRTARRPPRPSPAELAELMVGRTVLLRVEKAPATPGAVGARGRATCASSTPRASSGCKAVSFERPRRRDPRHRRRRRQRPVRAAGGAGAAYAPATGGRCALKGQPLDLVAPRPTPTTAATPASRHVPEDRQPPRPGHGLRRLGELAASATTARRGFAAARLRRSTATRSATSRATSIERFDIRPPSCDLKTANFSGGNQQKIVLAREIERDPDLLLIGQPTRGVDIGAIEFIHKQIVALRDRGKAILLVSVELDEILSLSRPHPR